MMELNLIITLSDEDANDIPEMDKQAVTKSLLSNLSDLTFEVDGKEIYVDDIDLM